MSTGNQGSQNYDEERSQRVGLQGYIRWAFLHAWFLLNVCNVPLHRYFYCPEQKKGTVVNLSGCDLDICTAIPVFIYF